MSDGSLKCPKCSNTMESGVKIDFIGSTQVYPERWMNSAIANSLGIVPGKTVNLIPSVKFAEHLIPVKSFRCTSCGFLEAYAQ